MECETSAEAMGGAEGASASAAGEHDSSNDLNDLPFQVKIQYTDVEGAVAMRVLTQTQPVTKNRRQAELCMFWGFCIFFKIILVFLVCHFVFSNDFLTLESKLL
jgi:hypothetical protein